MIILNEVSKTVGKFQLKNLSCRIPEGYVCGLVGQNGAGKTTFLHLLMGLLQPDSGELKIDDRTFAYQEKELHDEMGVVLTEDLLQMGFSLEKNGVFYGKFYSRFSMEQYMEYLTEFGLKSTMRYGKLSNGERLKGQLAFALACHPKYLILDEPTSDFDRNFRAEFFHILQEFISDGKKTVLLATHRTEDLDRLGDYLIYLEHGELIYSGDLEQFRETYRIVAGELYKIKLLHKEDIIAVEEGTYGTKALIKYRKSIQIDPSLEVTYPSIEEFMYLRSKRGGMR